MAGRVAAASDLGDEQLLLLKQLAGASIPYMNFSSYYHSLDPRGKADLADRLGTSRAYLSHLANGHRKPGLKILARIEQATFGKVTPADLRPEFGACREA